MAASLIYSQHVFTLCQRYGARASGDMYVDTSPIKHLRWSFLLKKPVAIFLKSSTLCLKYVWNGSEYDSASLENTNNLSSKKESGSNKNYYENVYDEDCFLEKVLEDLKIRKITQKINDFQYCDRPFSPKMLAVNSLQFQVFCRVTDKPD